MKLITPFTILNQNFHEMDLIREAMNRRRLATEKLHKEYRKIYKNIGNYNKIWVFTYSSYISFSISPKIPNISLSLIFCVLLNLGDLQWRHIKMVRKIDFLKICVNVLLKNMNPRIEIYFLWAFLRVVFFIFVLK